MCVKKKIYAFHNLEQYVLKYDIPLRDMVLFERALTHKSYEEASYQFSDYNNERLEFLGDSVLGFIVTEYLIQRFPQKTEGELSKIKSYVIARESLLSVAKQLDLHMIIRVRKSLKDSVYSCDNNGWTIIANTVEAVLGAIYLNEGLAVVRKFIHKYFVPIINNVIQGKHHKDYKSLLHHHIQYLYDTKPVYEILYTKGPDHDKCFITCVYVGPNKNNYSVFGNGIGNSKKESEQSSAEIACKILGVQDSSILF